MRSTIDLAVKHGVAVGAHPGYPDRERFGRIALDMPEAELVASLRRQLEAIIAMATQARTRVRHVKAHGALYNQAERDPAIARAVVLGIQGVPGGDDLVVFAPPASAMHDAVVGAGMKVAREGFIDRAYEPDGTLRQRTLPGALVTDPPAAAAQALSFARDGGVTASDGSFLKLEVDTLCIHGDTPGAPEIARAVRDAFRAANVSVAPFEI
jgi:UPF0271 protein